MTHKSKWSASTLMHVLTMQSDSLSFREKPPDQAEIDDQGADIDGIELPCDGFEGYWVDPLIESQGDILGKSVD